MLGVQRHKIQEKLSSKTMQESPANFHDVK